MFFVIFSVLTVSAQTFEKTLGAIRYMELAPNALIPLYTTVDIPIELSLNQYEATRYYEQYVKATEYPLSTWHAKYKNGLLQSAKEEGSDITYYFDYDNQNIIWRIRAYNDNTGQKVNEKSISSSNRLETYESENKIGVSTNDIYWQVYSGSKKQNGFVNVYWDVSPSRLDYSFLAIGSGNNHWYFKKGRGSKENSWLVKNYGLSWKKNAEGSGPYKRSLLHIIFKDELLRGYTEVNCAGLIVGNGMPNCCANYLDTIIRTINGNTFMYEYKWLYIWQ